MISRVTLYSFLLTLLLGTGLGLWRTEQRDECFAGGPPHPTAVRVQSGTRMIDVPCSDWTMRQPLAIQVLCLLDLTLGMVFVLSALNDGKQWLWAWRLERREP